MHVIVPYTNLRSATRIALDQTGYPIDYVNVSDGDDAYWELLDEAWQVGEDFAIVEQDIVVAPDTLASFEGCPQPWCAATYPYLTSDSYRGLGCVRFRAELISALPGLIDELALVDYPNHGPKHWCTLDAALQRLLGLHHYHVCADHGRVGHLSHWPSHNCVPHPYQVTVLMTVYNASEYLQQAIQSVVDQTFQDWRLLIMDDGSTDPYVQTLCSEATRDPRITYQRFDPSEEERAASARYATLFNWGAAHTYGKYITYLCGDDFYEPNRLARMVQTAEQTDAAVVYGAQRLLTADGVETGCRATRGVLTAAAGLVDLNSVLHTRTSFDKVRGWPDANRLWRTADGHMWDRLTDAGYVFTPVEGEPTDSKHYRPDSVDQRCIRGETPWAV